MSTALSGARAKCQEPAINLHDSERLQRHPSVTITAKRWRRLPTMIGPAWAQAAAPKTVAAASWMQSRGMTQLPVVLRTNVGTALQSMKINSGNRQGKQRQECRCRKCRRALLDALARRWSPDQDREDYPKGIADLKIAGGPPGPAERQDHGGKRLADEIDDDPCFGALEHADMGRRLGRKEQDRPNGVGGNGTEGRGSCEESGRIPRRRAIECRFGRPGRRPRTGWTRGRSGNVPTNKIPTRRRGGGGSSSCLCPGRNGLSHTTPPGSGARSSRTCRDPEL